MSASIKYIDDPSRWYAYALCIGLVMTSLMQFLAVEALFLRNMKRSVRGTLNGISFFFGTLGMTIFNYVGGVVFDEVAPWAPFMIVAGADAIVLVFAGFFIGCGYIKRED